MDLNDKDFTYANLQIVQIRRLLDNMLYYQEMKDSQIVNIGLDILRIICEISSGLEGVSEREWDLFFQAQKDEKSLTFFIHDLYMKSTVKNELLNEVLKTTRIEDLEKFIKESKGADF